MAKTVETNGNVREYLESIPDAQRRKDCLDLLAIMEKASGYAPKMWGSSIIGFGTYHYRYESGHEGDAPLAAFASRSKEIVLYLDGSPENRAANLDKLGKHRQGKGCLYISRLENVKIAVLIDMIRDSVISLLKRYPPKS